MKKALKFKAVILLLLIGSTSLSCSVDDGNSVPIPVETILDVAEKTATLSTLVSALQRADLSTTIDGATLYTVLAPSDTAFDNFLSANGYANIDAVPVATLRQLLLNHVLNGRVEASVLTSLQKNYVSTLAEGPETNTNVMAYFDATNGITFNGTSKTTQTDILASNGIIHIVDAVIELPTLETFISIDENFDSLETALDIVAPLSDVTDNLSQGGPFTVFAPTEHAFENLLATNSNWNSVSDIDETLLTAVIEHHVVAGNIPIADISVDQTLATLEGDAITFYNLDGNLEIRDGAGNEGSILAEIDIQALNGIIHLIPNQVLLPDTEN